MRISTSLALVAILLAPACSESPTEPAGPSLGERFSLGVGESVTIKSQRVTIGFERLVADSRCPEDVVCIWAGEAVVALSWETRGTSASSFQLSTLFAPQTTISGYGITLRGVTPVPRSNVRIDPGSYRVELVVTK